MKTLFCLAFIAFPAVSWAAQTDYREFIGTYTLVSKKILEPGNSGPVAKMCTNSVVITHDVNGGFSTKLVGLYNSVGTTYQYDEKSDENWLNISAP